MGILRRSDFESDKDWFEFLQWEKLCDEREFLNELKLSDSVFIDSVDSDGGTDDGGTEKS